jgi:hypothetical protein
MYRAEIGEVFCLTPSFGSVIAQLDWAIQKKRTALSGQVRCRSPRGVAPTG